MNIYVSYEYCIIITSIIITLLLSAYILFCYKKKKIMYSSAALPHPDIFINDIINAFYYSHMHAKNIKICIYDNQYSILFDKYVIIKSPFNSVLFKFLMHSSYTYFVFFVSQEGILEMIYFDFSSIIYDVENNILLTISHSIETNFFTIAQGSIILKNNNTQKTLHIIKEVLKNNSL